MSLAYKVDELLALRDSVSESAVSIEKFADEDVIREHVLRPSASAAANLNSRSSNSLRPPAAPAPTPVAPQKRPSPSPSLKRGKAEKLLKEHGSPPGLRVTAGGRIVPSDLPPLGTSRYSDAVYRQQQSLRAASGNVMAMQNHPNSSNLARIEVVNGQPVVFVGDRMFALPAVNTTTSALPVNGVAAMDPTMKRAPEPPTPGIHGAMPGSYGGPSRSATHTPFAGLDLATLKTQQTLKKQELKVVEQTEVLQANHQNEAWRAAMIEKKRSLIIELDALRKQISAMETGATTAQPSPIPTAISASATPIPSFAVQGQPPFTPAMYPFPAVNQFVPVPTPMYQPQPQPYSGYPSFSTVEPAAFVPSIITPQAAHSPPGSANRRSCAIEIKPPPPEDSKKPSALNPKSPTYEPATKSNALKEPVPPTPSPDKSSPWHVQEASVSVKHEYGTASRKHSLSSVDTTDFFPTNTHEHSSTRVAPQAKDIKEPAVSAAGPTTPEKNWPASPWNEGQSGHSSKRDPTPKLTSWPEAFGKQSSQQSLRPSTTNQSLSASGQNSAVGVTLTASLAASSRSSNATAKTHSGQQSSANQSWLLPEKPVIHVPSTYQEGYQAGYDHVGIPDNAEVLQGYIQGLLHFLTDESKKRQAEYQRHASSRTPSLRGLVADSLPHDPIFGTGISRNSLNGEQENVRLTKTSPSDDGRHNNGYNLQGHFVDTSGSYMTGHKMAQQSGHRVASSTQHSKPPSLFLPRMTSGLGQAVGSNGQKDASKGMMHNQGTSFHGDLHSNEETPQPFVGTQIQNRSQGASLTMQRLYSTAKERGSHELSGYARPPSRAFADLRLTGLDGAMDDLAEMMTDTQIDEGRTSASAEKQTPVEHEDMDASCFKSSNKGKQKATSSPAKTTDTERETAASSRTNTPGSPKKAGEHSPAKVKLEQVTNKFRRGKKDEGRTMSPDERTKRSEKWRQRFQQLKRTEMDEIEAYRRNSRT
ncbi:uncharacterized protein yc1106_01688 [Curvularia clavata]|uniref:Uncharacterized protein n=1 Tax=Curvularia clavata TaxID=95742 RepID=A0A9Q8Z1W0_CURCL|nr:uncharacterized protein yc1106_01688 [Curvularia clavata]